MKGELLIIGWLFAAIHIWIGLRSRNQIPGLPHPLVVFGAFTGIAWTATVL
jgi:hypothetical protein